MALTLEMAQSYWMENISITPIKCSDKKMKLDATMIVWKEQYGLLVTEKIWVSLTKMKNIRKVIISQPYHTNLKKQGLPNLSWLTH